MVARHRRGRKKSKSGPIFYSLLMTQNGQDVHLERRLEFSLGFWVEIIQCPSPDIYPGSSGAGRLSSLLTFCLYNEKLIPQVLYTTPVAHVEWALVDKSSLVWLTFLFPYRFSASATPGSSKSAGSDPSRGGTHRFALDTRTRHTRRSSTRARTGCATCEWACLHGFFAVDLLVL